MPVTLNEMDRQDPLDAALNGHGMTADLIVREGKKLLRAKKTVFHKLRKATGETVNREALPRNVKIVLETEVEVLLAIEVPDLPVRARQIQDFHRVMGHYPADRVKIDLNGKKLDVDVTQYSPEERAA